MRIKCLSEGCSWGLYATRIVNEEEDAFFKVKMMTNEHHCFSVLHPGHRQASATFLSAQTYAKLHYQLLYRPIYSE